MAVKAWACGLALSAIAALGVSSSYGTDYLCIPDLATGFVFENSAWRQASFNVKGRTYLITEVEPYLLGTETIGVEITQVGNEFPSHRCPPFTGEQIACGGLGMGFVLNISTLRFQDFYGFGFVDGGDSADNTPSLTIGKCSKLR